MFMEFFTVVIQSVELQLNLILTIMYIVGLFRFPF